MRRSTRCAAVCAIRWSHESVQLLHASWGQHED
jgi:hypothetical protein